MPTTTPRSESTGRAESLSAYLVLGVVLGIIFIKSEVASWFRVQEMFRFQAVHMYGVIGSAVGVGALGVTLLERLKVQTIRGEPIRFPDVPERRPGLQHAAGGTIFGLGWGLLGACPGPIYALAGSGLTVMLVVLLAAVAGAWVYGLVRPRLPH